MENVVPSYLRLRREELCYSNGLNLSIAKELLQTAETEAKKLGAQLTIAIVDSGGNLMAFYRMDNAILGGIQIAIDKAYTAVFGKQPTKDYCDTYRLGALPPVFMHERWLAIPGGFPIIKDKAIFGGIGISGNKDFECPVARAALAACGFYHLDDDAIKDK